MKSSRTLKCNRGFRILLTLALLFVLCVVDSEAAKSSSKKKKGPVQIHDRLRNMCKGHPAITDTRRLRWLVEASGEASLLLDSSPQNAAACWLIHIDKSKRSNRNAFLQRYVLSVLHYASTKANTKPWDWPMAVDEPSAMTNQGKWLSSAHECKWYGVMCSGLTGKGKIYELRLGFMKLDGIIPREMYLLGNTLKDLDFHANDFQGVGM